MCQGYLPGLVLHALLVRHELVSADHMYSAMTQCGYKSHSVVKVQNDIARASVVAMLPEENTLPGSQS
jgi:hypothetical protein